MKWLLSLLICFFSGTWLVAQDITPAARPVPKFKTPDECFAAVKKINATEPIDYDSLFQCQSAAYTNVQTGQLAMHLTRGAFFKVLPKKEVDDFLIKHGLENIDIFEVLQIASSPGGMGELKAFNLIGSRVSSKAEFMKGSEPWMTTYAAKQTGVDPSKPAPRKPTLKMSKLTTMGDTAFAEIVDEKDATQGKACFRLINGSWVLGYPGAEPKATSLTKAQRDAIAKLNEIGEVRMGDPQDDLIPRRFNFTYSDKANDDHLVPMRELTTFKLIILSRGAITDAGLKHLDTQESLEALVIGDTKVTEAGVLSLRRHKNLKGLELTNLDVSAAAIKQLQDALPNCEIIHRWNLDWGIAGHEHVTRSLKNGPVLVAHANEATEHRLNAWQKKLATRDAFYFGQKVKLCGVMMFGASPADIKALPNIDPKKAPQFFLYTKPGVEPVELSENASGADILLAIEKALKQ